MNKEDAVKRISEIREEVLRLTQEATEIADAAGISFRWPEPEGQTYYPNRDVWAKAYDGADSYDAIDKDGLPEKFAYYEPEPDEGFWMSSSDYC